ncbi:MAG: hypothetical protein ABIQ88_00980 [Chitinophagaceae bacterium]
MKKEISQTLQTHRKLSFLLLLLGFILLIYMITIEDEPGALPLFLILTGTVWLIINRYQIKKQIQKK